MTDPLRLGPGREFDLIREALEQDARIRTSLRSADGQRPPLAGGRILSGVGNDCAIISGYAIAISVDASIEGIHFDRDWMTPRQIGYRAAAAALSDLAPAAASPIGVFVTLAVTAADVPDFALGVMAGVSEAADTWDAALLGGDVSRTTGPAVIDVVVTGETPGAITRGGAKPGDAVWVTGELGAAGAALLAWNRGGTPSPAAFEAFVRPVPRIAEAGWLAARNLMTAAIDLSDGLAGDAAHLAAASGVRILLEAAAVPIAAAARQEKQSLDLALGGGEDFELCFTAPAGEVERNASAFGEAFATRLTRVGRVERGEGVALVEPDGGERLLDVAGYSHFTSE